VASKIIKLVGALVLFGVCMGFRSDVSEAWLRMLLAVIGFGLAAWGIVQMFLRE
jgi:hypothetical protein